MTEIAQSCDNLQIPILTSGREDGPEEHGHALRPEGKEELQQVFLREGSNIEGLHDLSRLLLTLRSGEASLHIGEMRIADTDQLLPAPSARWRIDEHLRLLLHHPPIPEGIRKSRECLLFRSRQVEGNHSFLLYLLEFAGGRAIEEDSEEAKETDETEEQHQKHSSESSASSVSSVSFTLLRG